MRPIMKISWVGCYTDTHTEENITSGILKTHSRSWQRDTDQLTNSDKKNCRHLFHPPLNAQLRNGYRNWTSVRPD